MGSLKSPRSTSFGYGQRLNFTKRSKYIDFPSILDEKTPCPSTYNLPKSFGEVKNGRAYTFGISREAYKYVNL